MRPTMRPVEIKFIPKFTVILCMCMKWIITFTTSLCPFHNIIFDPIFIKAHLQPPPTNKGIHIIVHPLKIYIYSLIRFYSIICPLITSIPHVSSANEQGVVKCEGCGRSLCGGSLSKIRLEFPNFLLSLWGYQR